MSSEEKQMLAAAAILVTIFGYGFTNELMQIIGVVILALLTIEQVYRLIVDRKKSG